MRLLVTGTTGQVAQAIAERAGPDLDVMLVGRPQLDLESPANLVALFGPYAPDVIVSAAAYTQVDKAQSEPQTAFAINAAGAGAVARAAADLGVPVIHLSTDYVFDGQEVFEGLGVRPLLETDPTGPINVYGASKLAGEAAVAEAGPDFAILRTAWVYAPFGANFVRTMLRLAETRPQLRVVNDQRGVPTSALDIAAAVEAVARNLTARPKDAGLRGLFNMTGSGPAISWAGFAQEIFRLSAAGGGPFAEVTPIPGSEYPTPAARPAWSCLSAEKLATHHGVRLPDWRSSLAQIVDRLNAQRSA